MALRLSPLSAPTTAPHHGALASDLAHEFFLARDTTPLALSHDPHPRYVEREVVYLAHPEEILRHVDLADAVSLPMAQSYFSREKVPFLLAIAAVSLNLQWGESPEKITNARIRHTRDRGMDVHELSVKTPRAARSPLERNEIQIPLSPHIFDLLSTVVCARHLWKYRLHLDGEVTGRRRAETVTAHIDILIDAGPHLAPCLPEELPTIEECLARVPFVTVDVELPSKRFVKPLREGLHTFPFLSEAVELSAEPDKVRRIFSTRRLASEGLDRRVRATARRLLSED